MHFCGNKRIVPLKPRLTPRPQHYFGLIQISKNNSIYRLSENTHVQAITSRQFSSWMLAFWFFPRFTVFLVSVCTQCSNIVYKNFDTFQLAATPINHACIKLIANNSQSNFKSIFILNFFQFNINQISHLSLKIYDWFHFSLSNPNWYILCHCQPISPSNLRK